MRPPVSAQLRLARSYDPSALAQELRGLEDYVRSRPGPFDTKGWEGIALIQSGGRADDTRSPMPNVAGTLATPALERCPLLRDLLLNGVPAPILAARLLYLEPDGFAALHRDPIGFAVGVVRLHIPIVTHPDVELWIGGERMQWKPGELWYGDFAYPHRLANSTSITRVHLVIDTCITEELLALFPFAPTGDVHVYEPSIEQDLTAFDGDWHVPRSLLMGVPLPERFQMTAGQSTVLALDPVGESRAVMRAYYPGVTFEIIDDGELVLVHRGRVTFEEGADPNDERTRWELFTSVTPIERQI